MQTFTTDAEENRYAELQHMALGFARNGESQHLAVMLGAGLPANLSDAKGNSLLMFAAMFGRSQVVQQLKARGASLQRRNRLGISARFMMLLVRPISLIFGRKTNQ